MSRPARPLAFCTIVAKNFLPFARVLARSVAEHHPDSRLFVLLADRIDDHFDPAAEPFEVIEAERLDNIESFAPMAFQYTVLELSTAVKPYLLEHLLGRDGIDALVYLDPDIELFAPLHEVEAALAERSLALTPHLTAPLDDGHRPDELTILRAGTYNLGFLGLAASQTTRHFLAWWKERTRDRCRVELERGLFVDQKWIDLVPGLFPDVSVLTHPGYNVAYWNLNARRVTLQPRATVNDQPLVFFHYSGIEVDDMEGVSKHQDRFRLSDLGDVARLFHDYRRQLFEAGFAETRTWPYAYGRFTDGVPIPDVARSLYSSLGAQHCRFGDPFAVGSGSFREWANAPVRGRARTGRAYLSRLLDHLHRTTPELQQIVPRITDAELPQLAAWLRKGAAREHALDPLFLAPVQPHLNRPLSAGAAVTSLGRRTARRLLRSALARRLKGGLRRLLGERRVAALKRRLAPRVRRQARRRRAQPLEELSVTRPGLDVTGYVATESGIGEGVRSLLRALATTGIPHSVHHLDVGVRSRMEDHSFPPSDRRREHDVGLVFVNADQVPRILDHLGERCFRDKYMIGCWSWELETFPEEWLPSFDPFHEIWTPSSFCVEALSRVAPIPVRRLPHALELEPPAALGRAELGLPEDRYLFLFVFDFHSFVERKNPRAILRAFRRAVCGGNDATVVIKTVNAEQHPEAAAELRREAEGLPVVFLDGYLSRGEVHGLIAVCDCYVSLHRSEGFGLTLAEAMYLGKPVIATAYSGNTDFLHIGNGLPVRYRMVEIDRDHGPYRRGWRWADPDVEHAAEQMRWAYDNRREAAALGERAREDVRRLLDPRRIGDIIRAHLERVARRVGPGIGA